MFSPLILAIVISFDSFGVGIAYGIKNVKFPTTAYFIIAICTTALMAISMAGGNIILEYVSASIASNIGAIILICIGLWELYDGWCQYLSSLPDSVSTLLAGWRIPFLGIMIQILRDPTNADFDNSSDISNKEAYTLGLALGLDAFVAGFGASMLKYSYYILPMVAFFCAGFVALGVYLGTSSINSWWKEKGFIIPGTILICMGILRLIF